MLHGQHCGPRSAKKRIQANSAFSIELGHFFRQADDQVQDRGTVGTSCGSGACEQAAELIDVTSNNAQQD